MIMDSGAGVQRERRREGRREERKKGRMNQ
jgi:hypothetical protein